jgi:dolichol-phosphate mannosyltransferase
MNAVIVLPTYNERESVGLIIDKIQKVIKSVKNHTFYILVVDDNSPDGTADVVKERQTKHKNIYLLTGKKKGLGAAYVRGFKYAMETLKADVVVEMDADGQHDPNMLPKFMQEIENGFDYVLGARYIPGGSVPEEWGLHRKIISYFGSVFARIVLWMPYLTDFTTGYRATRVKGILDSVDLDHLLSYKFAYKIHLLVQFVERRAKIKEIPLKFGLREKQQSKASLNTFFESLRVVLILRYRMSKRFIKVCFVGFVGALVQFGGYFLLKTAFGHFDGINIYTIVVSEKPFFNMIATELAIIVNFIINNTWTFKDLKITKVADILKKFPQFNLMVTGSLVIQAIVLEAGTKLTGIDTHFFDALLISLGILLGLLYNYTVYKKLIWKNKK